LAKAMAESGWDIQLVPTYTPIRTDESDVSVDHVLFGGLNVYLQQKIPFFRYLPAAMDHFLDSPRLIRRVTARAMEMDPRALGALTVSMLKGAKGNQRKEVRRLMKWLKHERPDLMVFTNILIGGCIESIKKELGIPVLVTLQGDDVFLDSLQEPFRSQCMEQIKTIAKFVDGFIVHTNFFRDYMASYFEIDPAKIHVTPLGIDVSDFARNDTNRLADPATQRTQTIGYVARVAPEKGLQHLVDAFVELKRQNYANVQLEVAGWLGPQDEDFANRLWQRLDEAGLQGQYRYLGSIDRQAKLEFLSRIDVFCVPTEFLEPKGLYVLEAMAAGIPVVQPAHGAFPELVQASQGGALFEPGNIQTLVDCLGRMLDDEVARGAFGRRGREFVMNTRNADTMVEHTSHLFRQFLKR
jgi:glycosyltransferase involved in cell wall biosynthesis